MINTLPRQFIFLGVIILLLVMGFYLPSLKKKGNSSSTAVIELFTSEGCSSCPAADALVGKIAAENHPGVIFLSYHVDYWNRLGWQDVFSDARYTKRQSQYGDRFKLNSVYTPQIVVNGEQQFVGSDEQRLRDALQHAATFPPLDIKVMHASPEALVVNASQLTTTENVLMLAIVQLRGESQVRGGENQGKHLIHTNIVRDLLATPKGKNDIVLNIPPGLDPSNVQVIAFLQNKSSGKILAASSATIK